MEQTQKEDRQGKTKEEKLTNRRGEKVTKHAGSDKVLANHS